ncbi:ABC transporter ATP-binding protein [Desulfoluna butyratoxydans]|nr:ABC transporter ATP-binding protein [Desulfoluna butyratoxydans]
MTKKESDRMDEASPTLVSLKDVTKTFKGHFWSKRKTILSGVTLELGEGTVAGIIGHNGAGKTSLFKILTGLAFPDKGRVSFGEKMGDNPRQRLGFLPENPYFYKYLTAIEALSFYVALFDGVNVSPLELEHALIQVGLPKDVHAQRLNTFSKGMLQRFGFAQALVNDPLLIILDEPMSGLDPVGRKEIRSLIEGLKRNGKTIVFSSHILDDVEKLCDTVYLLDGGRLVNKIQMNDILGKSSWCIDYSLTHHADDTAEHREVVLTKKELHLRVTSVIQSGGTLTNIERVIPPLEEWIDRRATKGPNI